MRKDKTFGGDEATTTCLQSDTKLMLGHNTLKDKDTYRYKRRFGDTGHKEGLIDVKGGLFVQTIQSAKLHHFFNGLRIIFSPSVVLLFRFSRQSNLDIQFSLVHDRHRESRSFELQS